MLEHFQGLLLVKLRVKRSLSVLVHLLPTLFTIICYHVKALCKSHSWQLQLLKSQIILCSFNELLEDGQRLHLLLSHLITPCIYQTQLLLALEPNVVQVTQSQFSLAILLELLFRESFLPLSLFKSSLFELLCLLEVALSLFSHKLVLNVLSFLYSFVPLNNTLYILALFVQLQKLFEICINSLLILLYICDFFLKDDFCRLCGINFSKQTCQGSITLIAYR